MVGVGSLARVSNELATNNAIQGRRAFQRGKVAAETKNDLKTLWRARRRPYDAICNGSVMAKWHGFGFC